MTDEQKIKRYEEVLRYYADMIVVHDEYGVHLHYHKSRINGPKMGIYEGETWELGNRATQVLRRCGAREVLD